MIKGEIVAFILRTAREFATRQMKESEEENYGRVFRARISGFSRGSLNGMWTRQPFDNDGQPCFQSPCHSYYLYYRSKGKVWVIDDVIYPSGSSFSISSTASIQSSWTTSPNWVTGRGIISSRKEINPTKYPSAYRNEAIVISGCARVPHGSYCGAAEDGVYLRQPPYDDINNQPHYIKNGAETSKDSARRHFFYSRECSQWQVSPVCNEDQGCYLIGLGTNPETGEWRYMPPDVKETKNKFEFEYVGYLERGSSLTPDPSMKGTRGNDKTGGGAAANGGAVLGGSVCLTAAKGDDEEVDVDLSAAAFGFNDQLLRWRDSNHECALFSNSTHTVSFMSFDPKRLRENMHPQLLEHLSNNGINVGEDLESLGSSHWKILSSLTGIHRSAAEAEKILGGNFCLTGDSLMKMLAIFYRVRCGVPVVLLGT